MKKERIMLRRETGRKIPIFKVLFVTVLVSVIALLAILVAVIAKAPEISALDAAPKYYRSSVLDDAGETVLTLSGEEANRVYVKLEEIPEDLQHAVIAMEDQRFYEHHGVDPRGIARAVIRGIRNGGVTEGASTITQQLLKNNVFPDWMQESNFREKLVRKIQEQYLAVALEMRVSKEWILENYLNTINLGGGNWGVETASRYYFDKDVSDLTLSECAVLAGITKNPTTYNPLRNPEKNEGRRQIVLQYMEEQGYITEEERLEALEDPVYERIAEVSSSERQQKVFNYFEDELVYAVLGDLMEEKGLTEEAAWDLIYRGGLTIFSTQDSALQEICEEAAADEDLFDSDAQISLVLIDNETGEVKAMIGGRGEKTASLVLNRATAAKRQPGSTIKVIGEYAAGINSGEFTLGTTFDDAPYTYSNGTEVENYDGEYGGMTTVREAIVKSDNIVALKCFQQAGMEGVWKQLQEFGISTLTEADRVEALALGGTSGGVTNLEMTAAYGTIARGGTYVEPVYYTKVLDRDGEVLLEKEPERHQAVSAETAALLTSALEEVVNTGTGTGVRTDGLALAGKSGTTTDVRDVWFLGFSPYYTCGVWGGFDDNSSQESSGYVQRVWKTVMTEANESLEERELGNDGGLAACVICTKCGKLAVDGLCSSTEQGDMTRTEYFAEGTAPTERCDCHTAVKVCRISGQKAGIYCTDCETRVYLNEGSEDTDDEDYVLPDGLLSSSCSTHKHFWSGWFGDGASHGSGEDHSHEYGEGTGQPGRDGADAEAPGTGEEGSASDDGWFTLPDTEEIREFWESLW